MRGVRVMQRDDGSIAVRNHLFILPAVVCANQVAIDVARRNPQCKYIEHQHGCAQIGADLVQTQRIFSNLAINPNVFASLFVGLGCEGIRTTDLFQAAKSRTIRPIELVMIQGSGGTLSAQAKVEAWVQEQEAAMTVSVAAVEVEWSQLTVGLLYDGSNQEPAPEPVQLFVQSLLGRGLRMVVPDDGPIAGGSSDVFAHIDHGELATVPISVMKSGSHLLETATGLAAAGVHFIIHFARQPHAFGNPLVPLIRFAMEDVVHEKFQDDFDGLLGHGQDVDRALERMQEIVEGRPSVAEELGLDDFALYRIGPTV
ncbi:UxaA family hydrolase [Alicyclobacillus kakegawensis]|uniref:UxaA family hydrolase n=1 Tax=Alicyclobacillus kakegawensis TaxID=392012 RepID=UPI0009FA16CC|nr:UxaA family hydrolase [Alicyclobacillus kakegawensis]